MGHIRDQLQTPEPRDLTPTAETLVTQIMMLTRRDDMLVVAIAALWALEGRWAADGRTMETFTKARLFATAILKRIQGKV